MSCLCLIPARAGSKRIPNKNIRLLAGRPLVEWTVKAAIESGCFSRIVVSSDSDDVFRLLEGTPTIFDKRPPKLAGDRVRFIEVLEEYLMREENRGIFDAVVVLLPTCPFRDAEAIRSAEKLFRANPEANVIAVTEYEFPPDFAVDLENSNHSLTLRHPEVYRRSTQSQSVKKAYHPCGAIYWGATDRILKRHSYYEGSLKGYLMDPRRAFDLDYPHQWPIAEALAENFLKL